jgi:hypothetical protein
MSGWINRKLLVSGICWISNNKDKKGISHKNGTCGDLTQVREEQSNCGLESPGMKNNCKGPSIPSRQSNGDQKERNESLTALVQLTPLPLTSFIQWLLPTPLPPAVSLSARHHMRSMASVASSSTSPSNTSYKRAKFKFQTLFEAFRQTPGSRSAKSACSVHFTQMIRAMKENPWAYSSELQGAIQWSCNITCAVDYNSGYSRFMKTSRCRVCYELARDKIWETALLELLYPYFEFQWHSHLERILSTGMLF